MKRQEAYQALELNESASEEEIKKAFKKAAIKYHPDRNSDNKEEAEINFKKINQAYQILTNKEKADDDNQQMPYHVDFNSSNFSDFIADFFGKSAGVNFAEEIFKNNFSLINIEISTKLTFEESVLGCSKNIKYNRKIYCNSCKGAGEILSDDKCTLCQGSGFSTRRVSLGGQFTRIERTSCQKCSGVGKIKKQCQSCNGSGGSTEEISLKVKIPAIGANITSMLIRGKGNVLNTTVSDCILVIYPTSEGSNEFSGYKIIGNDIFLPKKVKFDKLMFGGDVDVKLVNNTDDKINIKELSNVGDKILIKEKGVQGNIKGDLVVILDLEMPTKQIDKEKIEEVKNIIEGIYKENDGCQQDK